MTGLGPALLWVGAALLVAWAGLRVRSEVRKRTRGGGPTVDDEALRRILDEGTLPAGEEPGSLDLEAIEEEERRFWDEERWDDAHEW